MAALHALDASRSTDAPRLTNKQRSHVDWQVMDHRGDLVTWIEKRSSWLDLVRRYYIRRSLLPALCLWTGCRDIRVGPTSGSRQGARISYVEIHPAHCHRRIGWGADALRRILSDLPSDLPAAIALVLHTHPTSPRYMATMLGRHAQLPIAYAVEGDELKSGQVYLVPLDVHLIVRQPGYLGLDPGPKVNLTRPAADPLFETAALVFKKRVIGVVVTGGDGDGTKGLQAMKGHGGTSVVQSPADALAPSMPMTAIINDTPDHVVLLDDLEPLLVKLVSPQVKQVTHDAG